MFHKIPEYLLGIGANDGSHTDYCLNLRELNEGTQNQTLALPSSTMRAEHGQREFVKGRSALHGQRKHLERA